MKTTHKLTRSLSLVLVLAMVLTLFAGTAGVRAAGDDDALIDVNAEGSITVTKYAATEDLTTGNPTGTESDGNSVKPGYTPLEGVTFRLYQVADADYVVGYYDGTNDTAVELDYFCTIADGTVTVTDTDRDTVEAYTAKTTGPDGKCQFTPLAVGMYVLVEFSAPDQITTPTPTQVSLVSIPMVNTSTSANNENAKWVYDVFVFPKNTATTSSVTITKQDYSENPIAGVKFMLEKIDLDSDYKVPAGNWSEVDLGTDNVTGDDGTLLIDGLTAGTYGTQYRLSEISAPNGYIANVDYIYFYVDKDKIIHWNGDTGVDTGVTNSNPRVVDGSWHVDKNTELSFTLKNDRSDLTKKVQENGGSAWKQDEQYRLDDVITYRLTVRIPDDISEMNTFVITDTPQVGINDDESKVTIAYGSETLEATTQKVAATSTSGVGFSLDMKDSSKSGIPAAKLAAMAGMDITITYTAHMTAAAVINGVGNGNTAKLEYSVSTADDETNTYTVEDEARVYTYDFKITKYLDKVADNKEAGGVDFELLLTETAETPVKVVKTADGVYRLALTDTEEGAVTTMTTKADGTLTIQGLENGTYYLKETKTLDNYNLLSKPFPIVVDVEENTTWNESGDGYKEAGRDHKNYGSTGYTHTSDATNTDPTGTANIINKKGFVLPQTGSMGYLLFCTVGVFLIFGGALMIFGNRKKVIR